MSSISRNEQSAGMSLGVVVDQLAFGCFASFWRQTRSVRFVELAHSFVAPRGEMHVFELERFLVKRRAVLSPVYSQAAT